MKITLRYSPAEAADVTESATRSGLSAAAWIGQAAIDAMTGGTRTTWRGILTELSGVRADVREMRNALVAGHLHQDDGPDPVVLAARLDEIASRIDQVMLRLGRRPPP